MKNKKAQDKEIYIERRRYIRLGAVFPVEFQFLDLATGNTVSDIKQGFTRDVGRGGICLEVNNLEENFEKILNEKNARLDLRLHIPLSHRETKAVANIAWCKKLKSGYPNKYLIGLSFLQIDSNDRDRIYFHARRVSLTPKLVSILILLLILGLAYFYASDLKLKIENRKLVMQLVELSSKKSRLERNILDFNKERSALEKRLLANQTRLREYEDKLKELDKLSTELKEKEELLKDYEQDREEIERKLKEALSEREELTKRVAMISEKRVSTEDSLRELLISFEALEERNITSMYEWIKNHQNRITGLVVSYEGDKSIEDWAFTYDQSLASQSFTLKGDKERAQKILNFYKEKAERVNGVFANAYDALTSKVVEYMVHAGPNIWLGIAILQYTNRFKDRQYLSLAEDIARWLIRLQNEDREFGIRGGPRHAWFSTEHNLDAYAFFGMLYKMTEKKEYLEAQQRTFTWIKANAYNRLEGRLNRGKGDATIATDTFAWAIAAIGPEILKQSDMDPDQIMDFAERNCLVSVDYMRPGGKKLKITGFDFGRHEHLARGGIVSTEWTAQMVVTLRIMADYHRERGDLLKADYYKTKAEFYLSELGKMVIVSPSRIGQGQGCLPYATQDNVDTGHGWRVARGSRTGSTAGTAYTIFARSNYNPLVLD